MRDEKTDEKLKETEKKECKVWKTTTNSEQQIETNVFIFSHTSTFSRIFPLHVHMTDAFNQKALCVQAVTPFAIVIKKAKPS